MAPYTWCACSGAKRGCSCCSRSISSRTNPAPKALGPDYKRRVVEQFEARLSYEKNNDFHPKLASQLVELAKPFPGARVLDVATGTGLVAFQAARQMQNQGYVLGLDLSSGMLAQASSSRCSD